MAVGSWGTWATIKTPILYKKVSCATCTFYNREDCSCEITPTLPKVQGYNSWKKCKKFDLDISYMDAYHQEQVRKIKGTDFFQRKRDEAAEKMEVINSQERNNIDAAIENEKYGKIKEINFDSNLKDQIITSFINYMRINVDIIDPALNVKKNQFVLLNKEKGVEVWVILKANRYKKGKNSYYSEVDNWFNDISYAVSQLKTDTIIGRKMIIIPEIACENSSMGEKFYKKRGKKLNGIEIVEYRNNGELIVASGLFEKKWTWEKINNLNIFKE